MYSSLYLSTEVLAPQLGYALLIRDSGHDLLLHPERSPVAGPTGRLAIQQLVLNCSWRSDAGKSAHTCTIGELITRGTKSREDSR